MNKYNGFICYNLKIDICFFLIDYCVFFFYFKYMNKFVCIYIFFVFYVFNYVRRNII